MIHVDLSNVKAETGERKHLVPGGYICKIVSVENNPDKQYLKIGFDIAMGDLAGYAKGVFEAFGNWPLNLYRSYKESCKGMFKGFLEAVQNSNPGYMWDGDENKLCGKSVGIVLREEAYLGTDRDSGLLMEKTRVSPDYVKTTADIMDGKFSVRPRKQLSDEDVERLNEANPLNGYEDVTNDEELPF